MIYIAKMHTRYPDFHGTGYYNFLMSTDELDLEIQIAENSHDFMLAGRVKTRHKSISNVVRAYPSKAALNDKYFKYTLLRG